MGLTPAHWVYLAGVLLIIGVTVARKNVVVPALLATAVTAWVMTGSPVTGIQAIFNASLIAASELFNIFLIIAMVTALLGALRAMKADQRMVTPFQKVMRGGWSAYAVLAVVTYGISLFFWPTPAVPLIGAILVPAAIRAGLPAMGAAMAIAVAGQGMALSSDYVMQVAPGLSATAAGVEGSAVADVALVLSLVTGITALVIVGVMLRKHMRTPAEVNLEEWEAGVVAEPRPPRRLLRRISVSPTRKLVPATSAERIAEPITVVEEKVPVGATVGGPSSGSGGSADGPPPSGGSGPDGGPADDAVPADDDMASARIERLSRIFSIVVPVAFLAMIVYMVLGKITDLVPSLEGGSAAALVGGLAAILVVVAAASLDGPKKALQSTGEHLTDGLVFAFRAMGVVLPIAGFFFLGNADFAGKILGYEDGQQAPGLLVDLVTGAEHFIPGNPIVMCFGVLIIGMMCGLEGSGFSGLPLTGSLAGALGPHAGMDPATLAAVGQMGSVWAGGGVLVAWSSLLVVAGVTRVPVIELARKCFLPVVAGLVLSTLVAALFF
ncbi:membrane protein [Pseudonocardia yunnanensis]|uniref:Permease n=1 Tax=Pseudonocardia yunnanensis TaxID=58107 RepID=A0ABW4EYN3_9PSEU